MVSQVTLEWCVSCNLIVKKQVTKKHLYRFQYLNLLCFYFIYTVGPMYNSFTSDIRVILFFSWHYLTVKQSLQMSVILGFYCLYGCSTSGIKAVFFFVWHNLIVRRPLRVTFYVFDSRQHLPNLSSGITMYFNLLKVLLVYNKMWILFYMFDFSHPPLHALLLLWLTT